MFPTAAPLSPSGYLLIFPNSTGGDLFITSPVNCYLSDVLGRKYGEYKEAIRIDISEFPEGIYFLKTEEGSTFKIVKAVK